MLLMFEKRIKVGMYQSINRYIKYNIKCMKVYGNNIKIISS